MVLNSKKGFVIPLALIIAVILLTSSIFLSKNTTHTIKVKQKSIAELQNQYAVKSAMQHAMLKCLLMPTQLYDAGAFSIGQNPYFDFAEYNSMNDIPAAFTRYQPKGQSFYIKLASPLTPGPRFIAKSPTLYADGHRLRWSRIQKFTNSDLSPNRTNVPNWPRDMDGANIPNPSLYLWKYYDGIKFEFDRLHHAAFGYPYDFYYRVKSMDVAALDEQRKYNEEAIKIVVWGETKYRGNSSDMESNAVIRINRNAN